MRIWTAIRMTLVLTLLTGLVYPFLLAGLAQALFPFQARGSLVRRDRQIVGSRLIGQRFAQPQYFHGRPSAAGAKGYDATSSGGSNLAATNRALIAAVRTRLKSVLGRNRGITAAQVPVDLVTASGSGLDPDISPAAAELQIARVARARSLGLAVIAGLVRQHTRRRWLGIFGEPRVNVLMLNLALDRLQPKGRRGRELTAARPIHPVHGTQ